MTSQTLIRYEAAEEDPSSFRQALMTQTRSKLIKTFDDTTRVKTRCVTTTSRIGDNKLVTKSSSTTTTRTKRAKLRIEPLEAATDHAASIVSLADLNSAGVLEDFVRTVETEEEEQEDDEDSKEKERSAAAAVALAAGVDDVMIFNVDVTSTSPRSNNNDDNIAHVGEAVPARNDEETLLSVAADDDSSQGNDAPGGEHAFLPESGDDVMMTPPRDDVMTRTTFGVTRVEPEVSECYPAFRHRTAIGELPEGRSYKELYFDNVYNYV